MIAIETVKVINRTTRTYNGVRPNEVREINVENLLAYKNFGFDILGAIIPKAEEVVVDTTMTVKQIKEKLQEMGVEFPAKANKADLEKILEDATANAGSTGEAEGQDNLQKLLQENGIEFNEWDDLQQLAEENGLV